MSSIFNKSAAATGSSYAYVYNNSAQTNQTGSTDIPVTLDGALYDPNSWLASNKVTPNRAGVYLVGGAATMSGSSAVSMISANLYIWKNGSSFAHLSKPFDIIRTAVAVQSYVAGVQPSGSVLVSMNGTTDYVQLYVNNDMNADTFNITSGAANTYMWLHWVGP